MTRLLAWFFTMAALACSGQAWAQPVPAEASAPKSLADAILRAHVWYNQSRDEADKTRSLDACLAVLEPWIDEARRSFSHYDDNFPHVYGACKFGVDREGHTRGTEAELRAWLEPWRELLLAKGPDRMLPIHWRLSYHWNASNMGFRDEDWQRLQAEIQQRLLTLQADPDNSLVYDELALVTRYYFGAWGMQDEVRRMHAMYVAALGEGHRFSLSLLRSMAYHERFLGRPQSALEAIERAVALTRAHHADDVILNAHMATEYAACLSSAGRLADAAQQMQAARQVFAAQTPTPHATLARVDYNLAEIALDMSDFNGAIAHADSGIEHAQLSGNPGMLIEARVPRATKEVARLQLGQAGAAEKLKAVLAETEVGEMHIGGQAFALVEYAAAQGDTALLDWATGFADHHIRRFNGPLAANAALRPLMQAWRSGGAALSNEAVRPLLDRALAISLNGRSQSTLALTQFKLAQHQARDDPDTAIWLYKRGANALQQLRTGLPSGEPELHRSWLGAYEADLRKFIGLLIDTGRLVEAEQAMAVLRDEESHEYSRRSRRPQRASAVPEQSLSYTPAETLRNQTMQQVEQRAAAATAAADQRMDQRKARMGLWSDYVDAQAEADIHTFTSEVHRVVDEPPAATRGLSGPVLATEALPANTARLSYFVRDDSLSIVLQQGRNHLRKSVPVSRTELNRAIEAARAALNTPQMDALPALQALHRWLLAPFHAELKRAQVKNLIWVPDAALRYVPFSALHNGQRFLAQDYVVLTRWAGPASDAAAQATGPRTAVPTRPIKSGGIVAFGRSLGDEQHSALPGVQEELAATRLAGGQTWLNEQFTEQSLRQALATGPATVHLASHFELDPGGEEKSYLLLGDGQKMSLAALASLPWHGVKLALLSACDSGVSFDWGSGQAQVGFAASLRAAGVENVLATLWRISDGASAEWVSMLYARPSARAKRPTLQSSSMPLSAQQVATTQRQWLHLYAGQPLAHPHYWAAFIWLGS